MLFLSIVQTLLLIAIAGGVGYLVHRSVRGSRSSRRSLHSRRREIYADTVRLLAMLSRRGEVRKEELLEFRSRTQDAALVFDPEIGAYLDEIYNRSVKLMSTHELLKGKTLAVGNERDRVTVENAKHTIWLADQAAMVEKRFDAYPEVKEETTGARFTR